MTTAEQRQEHREQVRLARKRERDRRRGAHPFEPDRQLADEGLLDDAAQHDAVLVALTGGRDQLGLPAADFFSALGPLPARRLLVRRLRFGDGSVHELGSTVEQVAESLGGLVHGHRPVVLLGTSLGAFHAVLLGSLLRADLVVALKPVTSLLPEVRALVGDERRADEAAAVDPSWLEEWGDLPRLFGRLDPPPLLVHYAPSDPVYGAYAERLVGHPRVRAVTHPDRGFLTRICLEGDLRCDLLQALAGAPAGAVTSRRGSGAQSARVHGGA